jgi:hypothetical protein
MGRDGVEGFKCHRVMRVTEMRRGLSAIAQMLRSGMEIPMTKEPNLNQIPRPNDQIPKEDLAVKMPLPFGIWALVLGI